LSDAVSPGLIGPVRCWMPGSLPPISSVSSVISCARSVWLVTMRLTGPAPNSRGLTEMRESVTAALTTIGAGGRGSFA
jgi:hypothetical protein